MLQIKPTTPKQQQQKNHHRQEQQQTKQPNNKNKTTHKWFCYRNHLVQTDTLAKKGGNSLKKKA